MRFWMANKIYSFEEFAEMPDIEINFNESDTITEETASSSEIEMRSLTKKGLSCND